MDSFSSLASWLYHLLICYTPAVLLFVFPAALTTSSSSFRALFKNSTTLASQFHGYAHHHIRTRAVCTTIYVISTLRCTHHVISWLLFVCSNTYCVGVYNGYVRSSQPVVTSSNHTIPCDSRCSHKQHLVSFCAIFCYVLPSCAE